MTPAERWAYFVENYPVVFDPSMAPGEIVQVAPDGTERQAYLDHDGVPVLMPVAMTMITSLEDPDADT